MGEGRCLLQVFADSHLYITKAKLLLFCSTVSVASTSQANAVQDTIQKLQQYLTESGGK